MDQMQNGVQRQVVIRMFQPDMSVLKAAAKQVSEKPGLKVGLYGQAGEVIMVIAAQAVASAAATELSERAAAFVEKKVGDAAYGRGKENSLAHATAAEMIEDECTVTCADAETGNLMEVEFKTTKHGEKVFDFGQASFRNARMAAKIADTALMDDEGIDDPLQQAADRSYAVAKCTRAEFGTSITGTQGGEAVFAAVTYKGSVYIRAVRPAPEAGKSAALSVLDMIRRLILGLPIPYARTFKAGREVDWDSPIAQKAGKGGKSGGKSGGKQKGLLLPIAALVVLVVVLCVSCWFIYTTFFIKGDDANVPADGGISTSQGAASASLPASTGDAPVDAAASQSGSVAAESASAPVGAGNTTNGVVHPFT